MAQTIPSYTKLLKKRSEKIKDIKDLIPKSIIRGSIRIQGNICGRKKCRCKRKENPILHGPYAYLSFRGKNRNHSILLTRNKDIYAGGAINNYKRLMNIVIELSDIDFQILRYHSNQPKESCLP